MIQFLFLSFYLFILLSFYPLLDTVDLNLTLCGELLLDKEFREALSVVTSEDDDAVAILGLCEGTVTVVLLLEVPEDLGEVDHGVHLSEAGHCRNTLLAVTLLYTDIFLKKVLKGI